MNIFKAAYCRVFQVCLRLALPLLPYREPEILPSFDDIPARIAACGLKKPLIVTDKGVSEHGILARVTSALDGARTPYAVYDKTVPNPTSANVDEAAELYKSEGCDCLIGLGGGSAMDCAKGAGARIARPRKPLSAMEGILKVRKKIPALFAIPTTAGTGSETTLAAVIVDGKTRHKYAINDFPLIPRYAVLDPRATQSLPPFITATTGLDALTHAVEAFIGRSTTKKTRRESLEAVKLIFGNLPAAYADGNNLQARAAMLKAAYLAGCAFTKSYVGYVHAAAHALGGEYDVPHGYANAVLLPRVLRIYGKSAAKKLKKLAIYSGICTSDAPAMQAAEMFIEKIESLKKSFGIKDELPVKKEDIPKLARYADKEANPLYPVPKLMNAVQLEEIFRGFVKEDD